MARTKEFNAASVLKKAVDLFCLKGYNGTSAQDLVDELGISRSSLYDTYGDKKQLFIEALKQYQKEMSGAMIEMIDTQEDVEQTIRQIFEIAITDAIESKLSRGCFMVNATIELSHHDKEIATIVNQNMQNVESALCRAITKGQDKGLFSTSQSAIALARFLFNNISGIRVAARSGVNKEVYEDIVKVTMSALKCDQAPNAGALG